MEEFNYSRFCLSLMRLVSFSRSDKIQELRFPDSKDSVRVIIIKDGDSFVAWYLDDYSPEQETFKDSVFGYYTNRMLKPEIKQG